jgi:H+/Cl- antiporter ClcA
VALASATTTGVRVAMVGSAPMFAMPDLAEQSGTALVTYVALGAIIGVSSVYVTQAVYAVEDAFARLPVHWMWWPALGGVVVGVAGFFVPHTLGVGYDNISSVLSGSLAGRSVIVLCAMKVVLWATSPGRQAPPRRGARGTPSDSLATDAAASWLARLCRRPPREGTNWRVSVGSRTTTYRDAILAFGV